MTKPTEPWGSDCGRSCFYRLFILCGRDPAKLITLWLSPSGIMPICVCPYCGENFQSWILARDHMKTEHRDRIREALSRLPKYRIEALKKRGVDPENWIAGWILSFTSQKNCRWSPKDLGFNVQTNVKLPAKGSELEVDVY